MATQSDADVLGVLRRVQKEWTPEKYVSGYFGVDAMGDNAATREGVWKDGVTPVRWCVQGYVAHICAIQPIDAVYSRAVQLLDYAVVSENAWGIASLNNGPDGHAQVLRVVETVLQQLCLRQLQGITDDSA